MEKSFANLPYELIGVVTNYLFLQRDAFCFIKSCKAFYTVSNDIRVSSFENTFFVLSNSKENRKSPKKPVVFVKNLLVSIEKFDKKLLMKRLKKFVLLKNIKINYLTKKKGKVLEFPVVISENIESLMVKKSETPYEIRMNVANCRNLQKLIFDNKGCDSRVNLQGVDFGDIPKLRTLILRSETINFSITNVLVNLKYLVIDPVSYIECGKFAPNLKILKLYSCVKLYGKNGIGNILENRDFVSPNLELIQLILFVEPEMIRGIDFSKCTKLVSVVCIEEFPVKTFKDLRRVEKIKILMLKNLSNVKDMLYSNSCKYLRKLEILGVINGKSVAQFLNDKVIKSSLHNARLIFKNHTGSLNCTVQHFDKNKTVMVLCNYCNSYIITQNEKVLAKCPKCIDMTVLCVKCKCKCLECGVNFCKNHITDCFLCKECNRKIIKRMVVGYSCLCKKCGKRRKNTACAICYGRDLFCGKCVGKRNDDRKETKREEAEIILQNINDSLMKPGVLQQNRDLKRVVKFLLQKSSKERKTELMKYLEVSNIQTHIL